MILTAGFQPSSRLPAISKMATQFGVGGPTLREALKKLETVGVVDIRHGSGVYVGKSPASLLIRNPVVGTIASKKLLVDLIEARIPIEVRSAELAATNATEEHLAGMGALLERAEQSLDDGTLLNQVNLAFHGTIALGSGNQVLHQLLEVLSSLFRREQRVILDIHGFRKDDHAEHVGIFHALRARDSVLAATRMRTHLERVRQVLVNWNPPERDPQ